MKGNSNKGNLLIATISRRLRRIGSDRILAIRGCINTRKTVRKVEKSLTLWVKDGRHHECDNSMDEILDELGLTNMELSFYCSHILNKKFLSWRKEMRIKDAQRLLIEHPEIPVRHIGYIVGLNDKSYFRRQFKEIVGCTPTEWRERLIDGYVDTDD